LWRYGPGQHKEDGFTEENISGGATELLRGNLPEGEGVKEMNENSTVQTGLGAQTKAPIEEQLRDAKRRSVKVQR